MSSSDSAELTFVRCPSCRSLVPAVATRCRMCGASLDNVAAKPKSGESGLAKSKSSENNRAARSKTEIYTDDSDVFEPESDVQFDDPLSSYIEEVGEEDSGIEELEDKQPAPKASNKPQVQSQDDVFMDDEEESADIDPLKDFLDENDSESESGVSMLFSDEDESSEDEEVEEYVPEELEPEPEPELEPELESQPEEDIPAFSESEQIIDSNEEPEAEPALIEDEIEELPRPKSERHLEAVVDINSESSAMEASKSLRSNEAAAKCSSSSENIKLDSTANGLLCGWFVDFSDGLGKAYELRSGKYFLSSKALKPGDLVINNNNISTPHAMLVSKPKEGVVIQDLMSETGVYVCSCEHGSDFKKVDDRVLLKHGDKVRFGDLEFVLVMVP